MHNEHLESDLKKSSVQDPSISFDKQKVQLQRLSNNI